jgi:AcrR family transcriptional regulator
MARPPHARQAVIEAAEAIVKEIGAANLTYDELVRRSGITRGGITYHFPTKDALLQALVEHDLQRWNECLASKRRGTSAEAELRAYVESGSEPDEDISRLCAGMLSAAASAKDLNAPWRAFFAKHQKVVARCADPELAAILSLAVDGLFWMETLGLSAIPASRRGAVVKRMLAMADGMDAPAASSSSTRARR